MKRIWMGLMLVAGCGAGGDAGNQAKEAGVVQAAGLTGLYESSAARANQMCVIDRGAGKTGFGLVVWGSDMNSCSGAGTVEQNGNVLRLTMTGDEACILEARIDKGVITLPDAIPEGCAYYCGPSAKLGGASFSRKGATVEDAMKAKDLVGEPLCEGLAVAQ
jgi:hypothetical protein